MTTHPEFAAEQAYIDHAYECLESSRRAATALRGHVDHGRGGTFQNQFERDVIAEAVQARLDRLELGDLSLIFGRIDHEPREGDEPERFYIGRLAVSDEELHPVVVDWRAPVAEAFYRATGRDPMGLVRRRYFASRGRRLLGLEDELFGSAREQLDSGRISGEGALIAALEESRSGKLSDIVGTIQGEQDRIIRSPLPGILVVQGGPGTGKTVVALHRAAYLLYTHRFPLDGQGVLVVGPNRVFLSYIDQVLPSLGEAGVRIAVLGDLVPGVRVVGVDRSEVARVKGDLRMVKFIRRAVRDRQRPLRRTLRVPYGTRILSVLPHESEELVAATRRRARNHNAGRRFMEQALYELLWRKLGDDTPADVVRDRVRREPVVKEALERMWPVLTPAELLNDLFGSRALLRSAGGRRLRPAEIDLLCRERVPMGQEPVFTHHDVPLLDEALEVLGPRPRFVEEDSIRTYGHIVVDEAQDLSPMELRVLDRRSLNGSMTIVGDIAQATGAWPHDDWDDVLRYLPERKPPRCEELTIGYRVPGPIMDLAARVLRVAAPELSPPSSIRAAGDAPVFAGVAAVGVPARVVEAVRAELAVVGAGNVGVICPDSMVEELLSALAAAGIEHGRATRQGLDRQVTVVPVSLSKGLELDSVVVVEPGRILDEEARGPQSLYVALTRSTKRLTVVYSGPLPAVLEG